jgi:hypothetical protein
MLPAAESMRQTNDVVPEDPIEEEEEDEKNEEDNEIKEDNDELL